MEQKPRLLTPGEDYRFKLVEAVAFEGTIDYEEEKRKSRSSPSADENCRKIGVFSEDEAVLYGCLLYNKYRCYCATSTAGRCCLGAWAALPHCLNTAEMGLSVPV